MLWLKDVILVGGQKRSRMPYSSGFLASPQSNGDSPGIDVGEDSRAAT